MKFDIAPDKFKGSLTGFDFCEAVAEGIRIVFPDAEILRIPLADGGDGTIEIVNYYLEGEKISIDVHNPFYKSVEAPYLYSDKSEIAFIEMAESSGLKLLKESQRNCSNATTFGTGELIADALNRGAKEIILGIGGSATNDGGMGMANALGFLFLDENDRELKPIRSYLILIKKIEGSKNPKLDKVKFKVACDVSNPFYGENGAAKVYAAQKGATADEIEFLDEGLRNFSKVIEEKYGIDLQKLKGSGAAGGICGGAFVFLRGQLTSGIDLIKELANFDNVIERTDWIITGEGQLDAQTLSGKTISSVVISAAKKNIPVAALDGSVRISIKQQEDFGLAYETSIVREISNLQDAMKSSYENLVNASYNFVRLMK